MTERSTTLPLQTTARPGPAAATLVAIGLVALIISAGKVSAQPPPSAWDFETGNLQGWQATGTAFASQPTRGDNSAARRAAPARQQGNYWIGTYERYQGRPGEAPGAFQGDGPTGTLTSRTFTIAGGTLSFLVGGGSQFETRVELRILDQIEGTTMVRSASGQNTETMRRERWDLSQYVGRRAHIRIVDESSVSWGHINADDFRFPAAAVSFASLVSVPSLVGGTVTEAIQILDRAGLQFGDVEGPAEADAKIVAQRPRAQNQVPRGSSVDVVVESRPPTPELIGQTMREALPILAESGLKFGTIRGQRDAEAKIIDQRPRPREPSPPSGEIDIVLERIKRVPALQGLKKDDALRRLRPLELVGSIEERAAEKPLGTVIDQDPAPGTVARDGDTVTLVVVNPQLVQVPPLKRETEVSAVRRLERFGLRLGQRTEIPSAQAEGTIVDQSPPPGTPVPLRSEVNLVVAQPVLVVPDLRGVKQDDALRRLRELKLVGSIEEQPSDKALRTVIEQAPPPGSPARPGDTVTLVVVNPHMVKVPDLKRQTFESAVGTLERVGLRLGEQTQALSGQFERSVVDQRPPGGALVAVGSKVDLVLAQAFAVVPDVTNQSVVNARKTLTDEGLELAFETPKGGEDFSGRTVESQAPTAGKKVPVGSTVRVQLVPASPIPWLPIVAGGVVIAGLLAFFVRRNLIKKNGNSVTPPLEALTVRATRDAVHTQIEHIGGPIELEVRLRPHKDAGRHEVVVDQGMITREERTRD